MSLVGESEDVNESVVTGFFKCSYTLPTVKHGTKFHWLPEVIKFDKMPFYNCFDLNLYLNVFFVSLGCSEVEQHWEWR